MEALIGPGQRRHLKAAPEFGWLMLPDVVAPWRHTWVAPLTMLPTSPELHHMASRKRLERDDFFISAFVLFISANVVLIELLRGSVSWWYAGYAPLSRDMEEPDTVPSSREDGGYQFGHLVFALYHVHYTYFCLGITAYAAICNMLDMKTGLVWELYGVWLTWVFVAHWVCASLVCFTTSIRNRGDLPCFWVKVVLSVTPGFSELVDVLRDSITIGIYAAEGDLLAWLLAVVCLGSMLLPYFVIYQEAAMLDELKANYLPILSNGRRRETSSSSALDILGSASFRAQVRMQAWDRLVQKLDDATLPSKQAIAFCEDLPQVLCGVIFSFRYEGVLFVLLNALLSTMKILAVHFGRPYILCWLANSGRPWTGKSARDVGRAMRCASCAASVRVAAAAELLRDVDTPADVCMVAAEEAVKCVTSESPTDVTSDERRSLVIGLKVLLAHSKRRALSGMAFARLCELGACTPEEKVNLFMVAKIYGQIIDSSNESSIRAYFARQFGKLGDQGTAFEEEFAQLGKEPGLPRDVRAAVHEALLARSEKQMEEERRKEEEEEQHQKAEAERQRAEHDASRAEERLRQLEEVEAAKRRGGRTSTQVKVGGVLATRLAQAEINAAVESARIEQERKLQKVIELNRKHAEDQLRREEERRLEEQLTKGEMRRLWQMVSKHNGADCPMTP